MCIQSFTFGSQASAVAGGAFRNGQPPGRRRGKSIGRRELAGWIKSREGESQRIFSRGHGYLFSSVLKEISHKEHHADDFVTLTAFRTTGLLLSILICP
jgi:hypothetical protein